MPLSELSYSSIFTAQLNCGRESTSNHGTFYYNQLAALKLLVNDSAGAKNATNTYFNTLFLGQISADGDQVGFCSMEVAHIV